MLVLPKEVLNLIEKNVKEGVVPEEFDDEYKKGYQKII
ncbi:MAG: hypothetical protein TIS_03582 [Tissierella sp.]